MHQITLNIRKEDNRALEVITQRGLHIIKPAQSMITDMNQIANTAHNELTGSKVSTEFVNQLKTSIETFRNTN